MSIFTFEPRWKEELLCSGPGGTFVLELSMGVLSAYLPTEESWKQKAPVWAGGLWPALRSELETWCGANETELVIDSTAGVF